MLGNAENGTSGSPRGSKRAGASKTKSKVWAAVTSCLTNVPPTPGLRSEPASVSGSPCRRSDRAGCSGAWGGFLATPCDRASPAHQQHVGSPPPPGRPGQDHSFPAPSRTAPVYLHTLTQCAPEPACSAGALHGETPESPKDQGARSSNSVRPGSPHSAARARLGAPHSQQILEG